MKKLIVLLLVSTIVVITKSQNVEENVIDYNIMRCMYKLEYLKKGKTSASIRQDTMALDIGNKVCKFYSYRNFWVSKVRSEIFKKQNNMLGAPKLSDNKYKVYIDFSENNITVIDNVFAVVGSFEYSEDLKYQEWTIHNETQTILNYNCKKATCRYSGRDYIAWYTDEIAISRGPYKFGGLPGLILKIQDSENHYIFECVGIEKNTEPIVKDVPKNLKNVSKKDFFAMNKRNYDNPVAAGEAMFKALGRNVDLSQEGGGSESIPYNSIELEW